jgi:proteasome lid subunit RPN8/RPN11
VTPPPLVLPRAEADAIIAHARATHPRECCGLIAGQNGQVVQRYPITNVDQTNVFYLMEPREQYRAIREMDERGWDLLAIYHSHPASPAYPSRTDIARACYEGTTEAIYPDTYYVICSLEHPDQPVIRAFRILDGQVHEADVTIA